MAIFGADGRTRVYNTTADPYSAIVRVNADFNGDGQADSWGTGAMISPNDVLTAGHVLWSSYYGYAKNVWVTPAVNGSSEPFGTVMGTGSHVPSSYISTYGSTYYDIGVVNLGSSVGNTTGTFNLQATTGPALVGTSVTTAGYPGDFSDDGSIMVTTSGTIVGSIGSSIATFLMDAYPGQSGSPIWIWVNGAPTIVDVVTFQTWLYNGGTVITETFYNNILSWTDGDINGSSSGTSGATTGTDGADWLTGGTGDDIVSGGSGTDTLKGNGGDDILYGNIGVDTISGGDGADTIFGGQNDGPAGSDGVHRQGIERLHGGAGDDVLYGNMGSDRLTGGAGADTLYGGQDYDSLIGGVGDDRLFGNMGRDVLNGGDGNDYLYGNDDVDTLSGGNGDDTLDGGENVDTLRGGAGSDTLYGGDGNDVLSGGDGGDLMYGDNPYYTDGAGTDTLYGGGGTDTAVYIYNFDRYFFEATSDGGIQINRFDVLYDFEYVRFADTIVATDSLI